MLLPPLVVAPVSTCSKQVRVLGAIPGATVQVQSLDPPSAGAALVASGTASYPDATLDLNRALGKGERLVARQTHAGQGSDLGAADQATVVIGPPTVAALQHAILRSPFFRCARCLELSGLYPGADVTIIDAHGHALGAGTAPTGTAHVDLSRSVAVGEQLFVRQHACSLTAANSPLPHPIALPIGPVPFGSVPFPAIAQPVRQCERAVSLSGCFPGAAVHITRTPKGGGTSRTFTACVVRESTSYRLPVTLAGGDTLVASQAYPGCELTSPSSPPVTVGSTAPLPTPIVVGPVCFAASENRVATASNRVRVTNLVVGANVTILGDGQPVGTAGAYDTTCDFLIPNFPLGLHAITAQLELYGTVSALSDPVTVEEGPGDLPIPALLSPLYSCVSIVHVDNVHPGAQVTIVSQQRGIIGRAFIYAASGDVPVAPALVAGDRILAEQSSCGLPPARSAAVDVLSVDSDYLGTHPPALRDTFFDCRRTIPVAGVIPGATIEVYVQGVYAGSAVATKQTVDVPLARSLHVGDSVVAIEQICGLTRASNTAHVIAGVDKFDVEWVPGSTQRVSCLTGPRDPQGWPHVNDTDPIGIHGTDLGIATDFIVNGEHRTYFFFGDTGDQQTDPIAYTTDASVDPTVGLKLTFLTYNGGYVSLTVPGEAPMGNFEVPTGAFSVNGKLYVFCTKDPQYPSGATPLMGRSFLVTKETANPGSGLFRKLYDVSTIANGGKFINVSAVVVKNDDWIGGLPSNARPGELGVLMFGSGRYRRSDVYMAYCPAASIEDHLRTEWRYYGRAALGGAITWSVDERAAERIHDDPHAVVGELSVQWDATLKKWLLFYNNPSVIEFRYAQWPWGPWSRASGDRVVFDADRDGARGTYVHSPKMGDPLWEDTFGPEYPPQETGGIYGPYILPRYSTRIDGTTVRIYFTVSTHVPYQVMLMRTDLRLVCK